MNPNNKKSKNSKEVVVVASGYFNPLHVGHVRYFKEAKKLGTKLIVIGNTDEQAKIKGTNATHAKKDQLIGA